MMHPDQLERPLVEESTAVGDPTDPTADAPTESMSTPHPARSGGSGGLGRLQAHPVKAGTRLNGGHEVRPRSGNPVPEDAVAAMFDEIAPVYDRMNTLMTFGADGRWRRAAVMATAIGPGDSVVDVACGTGKLAAELAAQVGPFGRVAAVDLSSGMIERATATYRDLVQLEFHVANALHMPFHTGEFDAATIAFGMRNLADYEAGFRELARVVRPSGWVVCLELSMPRPEIWGRVFHGTFRRIAPVLGSVFGRKAAYSYLPTSLEGFPDPDHLARTMELAGLQDVSYRQLGLGAVALHRGRVPGAE